MSRTGRNDNPGGLGPGDVAKVGTAAFVVACLAVAAVWEALARRR